LRLKKANYLRSNEFVRQHSWTQGKERLIVKLDIGAQIKKFRQQQQISQQELADYLHLSRQTVSKWELGKSLPDLENVIRLSEYFNVSIDVLIGYKKPGFFRNLFEGKTESKGNMMDEPEKNASVIYSSYTQDIQPLFARGKRVKAFIKIEDRILPQVTFSRLMGNANCLCSFNKTNVTIEQTGKFKFLVNLPIEKQIASFPLSDIQEIKLSFGKSIMTIGGNFATFIDIITEDKSYFLGADSLKAAHWLWHADLFADAKIPISATFPEILTLEDEEEAAGKIREQADQIPLFYAKEV
jgi:transcriptional regulator with XRE-family HTH domain